MPVYRANLRMAHDVTWPQRRKWSTTFHMLTANVETAAAALVGEWVTYLRNAASDTIFAYEVYASDMLPGTSDYVVLPIPSGSQRGTIDNGANQPYLLKTAVRVNLNVAGSRPSFKFWRPGLVETQVENGVAITAGLTTAITTAFTNFISDLEGVLVDVDGQPVTTLGAFRLTTREFGRYAGNDVPSPPVG
jgi:hypothetical protein